MFFVCSNDSAKKFVKIFEQLVQHILTHFSHYQKAETGKGNKSVTIYNYVKKSGNLSSYFKCSKLQSELPKSSSVLAKKNHCLL